MTRMYDRPTLGPDGWIVDETPTPALLTWSLDASGNPVGLVGPDGRTSGFGQTYKPPRILKRFLDLANCTITPTTATVTATIDQNSPFGGPALKLAITPTGAGRVDVDLTNLNIPLFNGHIAADVYVEDVTRISQFLVFQSDAAFANYSSWTTIAFSGGDLVAGHRVVWGGPMHGGTKTDGGTGFVSGTTTLDTARLRIMLINNTASSFNVWVRNFFIPARQRPIVCFTWDDAYATWMTRVRPYLNAAGIKATFGIYSAGIDAGGAYVTSADVQTLIADGHQVASHNVNNYRLQTLASHGNGELNGSGTSNPSDTYATEYHTARQVLEALGADYEDFCYHPWVQGGVDTQGVELLRAGGVEVARTTSEYNPQPYGFAMGNNAMNLRAWPLSNQKTLAQNKAAVDNAVQYGGLLVFIGHDTADTAANSTTAAESDVAALIGYCVAQDCDILTMRQLRDRLKQLGCLATPDTNPAPAYRMIARLSGANFNTTTDQAITLPAGNWTITNVFTAKGSISMTTAAGGVYTAGSKGGTAIVAAAQTYTGLAGATTDVVTCTMAATPTVSGTIYFSLTTAQGAAATGDVFVFGKPA